MARIRKSVGVEVANCEVPWVAAAAGRVGSWCVSSVGERDEDRDVLAVEVADEQVGALVAVDVCHDNSVRRAARGQLRCLAEVSVAARPRRSACQGHVRQRACLKSKPRSRCSWITLPSGRCSGNGAERKATAQGYPGLAVPRIALTKFMKESTAPFCERLLASSRGAESRHQLLASQCFQSEAPLRRLPSAEMFSSRNVISRSGKVLRRFTRCRTTTLSAKTARRSSPLT